MIKWIKVADRVPEERETIDGRVPIIDRDGYLGFAVLANGQLLSEYDVEYWLPVPQLEQ
jgi:hypothetical protein